MDNRGDNSASQGSWIPVTPGKPGLAENHVICTGRRGNESNAREIGSFSQGKQHADCINLECSSPPCFLYQGDEGPNRRFDALGENPRETNRLYNVGIYSSFSMDNVAAWNTIPCTDLLALADAAVATTGFDDDRSPVLRTQETSVGSNVHRISNSPTVSTRQYGQAIGSRPFFDLNSPPRSAEAYFTVGMSSQFTPLTPDQTSRLMNRQLFDQPNSNDYARANQTTCKDNEVSGRRVDEKGTNLDEGTQLLQEQSCAAISTQLEENQNPDKGSNEDTTLNRTPQQKQRRRKHRPKVVIEGQAKTPRKPKTPKPEGPNETPTGKRKYVRRKGLNNATPAPNVEEEVEATDSKTVGQTRKSSRRRINFDAESQANDERQVRDEQSSCSQEQNLRMGVQSNEQFGQGINSMVEKAQMGVAINISTQSINRAVEDCQPIQASSPLTPCRTDPPPTNPSNDGRSTYANARCQIHFLDETHDKVGSSAPSPNPLYGSSGASCENKIETRGLKRRHPDKPDGMGSSRLNEIGSHYNSIEAYLSMFTDYNILHFPVIHKKKRTEKGHAATSSTKSSVTVAPNFVGGKDPHCLPPDNDYTFSAAFSSSRTPRPSAGGVQDLQQSYKCMLALGHMESVKKKRSKGITRVRNFGGTAILQSSFAGLMEGKQTLTPSNGAAPSVMQGFRTSQSPHTCMEALAADIRLTVATKKRTKRNSAVGAMHSALYHDDQFFTNHLGFHMGVIDSLVEKFRRLDINTHNIPVAEQETHALVPYLRRHQKNNQLVLYQQDGSIIPFEGLFDPVRRRKPRPKVDLDEETSRVWKLLLENINSQGIDGTDEDKAKWWEEERRVFRGRADSFIARMHLVQGDRRFSQWKGSVVDSVIGVFLTQNVSDHLSSSAFMSLAARYPLKSNCSSEELHDEMSNMDVQEPCELELDETIKWHEQKSDPLANANDQNSMTVEDTDYNEEKEVVNSKEIVKISNCSIRSNDKSDCEGPHTSGSDLTVYHESAAHISDTHASATAASLVGSQKETDDMVSSQNSVISSLNSVDSSSAQNAERTGSRLQDNYGPEQIAGSGASILSTSTSFIELLHMQGTTMLHAVYDEDGTNDSSDKKDVQENTEGMACSQQQDGRISDCPHTSGIGISPNTYNLQVTTTSDKLEVGYFDLREETRPFEKEYEEKCTSEQSGLSEESASQSTEQKRRMENLQQTPNSCNIFQAEEPEIFHSQMAAQNPKNNIKEQAQEKKVQKDLDVQSFSADILDVTESNTIVDNSRTEHKVVESNLGELQTRANVMDEGISKVKSVKYGKGKQPPVEWDSLRKQAEINGKTRGKTPNTMDSLDYEAVRCADVNEIADTIKERGMNNMLAERIKDFLNRLVRDHGSIDLEWLRDVPPDKAKEYLLSFRGLGLKSVECVRLLSLHHLAFPVDTNVGRIAVRLGWVPLQPLPESLQLHLLELYPVLESIQKYLWPRLCKLDQKTLYELHYQMITFGKVFCTKSKPNCNACPMRGECRHFASAFASARLALPAPEEKSIVSATENRASDQNAGANINGLHLPLPPPNHQLQQLSDHQNCQPVIEEPASPEPIIEVPDSPEPEHVQQRETDIEDTFDEDPEEIPTIKLNIEAFTQNLQNYMEKNMELGEGDMSRALVALTPEAASIPTPKLKNVSRLRTEHQVYELPDSHPLLEKLDKREPDDPCSYLLAIWTPGETADSIQPPEGRCSSQESGSLCDDETCFSCNSIREANAQTVRGTLLIPCRTAMRGSFPLNGTYFQVNEVFADHDSSLSPIDVPRSWLWNLPRRTVYFGTSIPTIFKGLTTEGIQYCFWRGFVCVRGFDQKTRAPRPLMARLHFPASKLTRTRGKPDEN